MTLQQKMYRAAHQQIADGYREAIKMAPDLTTATRLEQLLADHLTREAETLAPPPEA